MTISNKYENMVEQLEKLKEKDEYEFIKAVNSLSNEDFVGIYKAKSYTGTDEGIFGYFGNVYFNNEDIDEYLVNKGYVLGTLIVPDEMKDKMRNWKYAWYECIENKLKNGLISQKEAFEEVNKAFGDVNDMIETYESNCLEYLIELYQKYEDEIDTYFILEQRDRIIEELEDEYL